MSDSRFDRGDAVEVLCEPSKRWCKGVVLLRWREMVTFENRAAFHTVYDVDGEDAEGPFSGRFTEDHVRASGTANETPPVPPANAGGKQ